MNAVIIVAGGKGLRMGGDIPKQFLPVGGIPILMRTIDRFLQFDEKMQVVLVLPETQQDYWRTLCDEYHFSRPYEKPVSTLSRTDSPKSPPMPRL